MGLRPRLPASYRGRLALTLAAVLLVALGAMAIAGSIADARARERDERALREQAELIAEAVDAVPDREKADRAAGAARFLVRTRIVVTWPAPPGLYYNVVPLTPRDAEVTVRAGDVEVRLTREASGGGRTGLVAAAVVLLVGLLGAGIWYAAGRLTRGLRRQTAELAATAQALADGRRDVRADASDDELGRVAVAFNHMAQQLEDADARQRRFLADVAHELRTPVTAIDGFAGALADGTAGTDEDRAEAAAFIRQETARLSTLVADLRLLTRLDLEPEPQLEPLDLRNLADDALRRIAPQAEAAGVALAGPTTSVPVITDRAHVETVLANLLSNAVTATPSGGRVRVDVGVDARGPWLAVADTGVGIAPEHLPRIFDRLYRVDAARTRDGGGSGLGLAIVRRTMALLGGEVTAESTPGHGSTFTLRFPAPDPAATLQPTPTTPREP